MNHHPATARNLTWTVEREAVLREALDQYVANARDYVDSFDREDDPAAWDREDDKLSIAELLLDELTAGWLDEVNAA